MIYQNDKRLNFNIRNYGCRFRCLQAIAEHWSGKNLSAQQIEDLYHTAIEDSTVMMPDCTCGKNEHEIIAQAFMALGHDLRAKQIGAITGKKVTFWDERPRGFDYIIDRWSTKTGQHFVLVFLDGTFWNPWDRSHNGPLPLKKVVQKLLYRVEAL